MVDEIHSGSRSDLLPFLKWAGGKRWLTEAIRRLVPAIEGNRGTYYEPFLGSGAMFFALNPKRAVLNDLNSDLINLYRSIRKDPAGIKRRLREYHKRHSVDFYYEIRGKVPTSGGAAAARFLYLNRTCWNGLYRVNLKGEFNVPVGTKTNVVLPTDDFDEVCARLSRASLHSRDFAEVICKAGRGDMVFADPPYTVNHNLNGFLKYNEQLFSWKDQERLCEAAVAAASRGAKVVISNADHASIRKLYKQKLFVLHTVRRFSKLSGSNKGRRYVTELLIASKDS